MNNPTQQIKQMTKNLFKAKSGSSHVKILHPKRDWLIGMGVAACIVVGITVWNGYTYLTNRDGGSTDTEIEIANPRYQAELVSEALGVFESRSDDFAAISSNTPVQPLPEPPAPVAETIASSTPEVEEENSIVPEEGVSEEAEAEGEVVTGNEQPEEFTIPELSQ